MTPTDAELIAAARTDAAAFRTLYDRYAARILRLPRAPHRRRRRRARPDRRDVRAGVARAHALPRRGRRLGRAVAVRDRPPRAARLRAQAAARAHGVRAARARARAGRRRAGGGVARGLDEALAALPEGQREAIRLRFDDDLAVRRRRRLARHDARGRPRARAPRAGRPAHPTLRRGAPDDRPHPAPRPPRRRARARRPARPPPAPRRRRRGAVLAAVAALVAVPGAAVAGERADRARRRSPSSIPAGTLWLAGHRADLQPSCQDVEYRCSLGTAPGDEIARLDRARRCRRSTRRKHVNGGCRSLNADGHRVAAAASGEAAVEQQIIGAGFLGEYAPSPGVG